MLCNRLFTQNLLQSLSNRILNTLLITFSGVNITDKRPPYDETETSWPFYNALAYPGASRGANYSLELTHRF